MFQIHCGPDILTQFLRFILLFWKGKCIEIDSLASMVYLIYSMWLECYTFYMSQSLKSHAKNSHLLWFCLLVTVLE